MKEFSEFSKSLQTKRFFLILFGLWLVHKSSGTQILYLQETEQAYTGASYSSALLSTLTTSLTTSMQYTMSSWVQITTQPSNWITIFNTVGHSERILYATIKTGDHVIYTTGTPTNSDDIWTPWEGLTLLEMFPTGKWVFLAFGTDSTTNMQYGFRYYPQSTTQLTAFFDARKLTSPSYNVTPSCTAFWGGDNLYTSPGQTLQYVRLYIDYVPTSQDEMINLAIMQPGGTLYYFLLTTDYEDVQNSTFPIQYYQNTTQGFDTISINPTYPVTFGPFNMIMCRPGAILSYNTGTNTANRINIAFDVKIYSPATAIQNLFSIRDNSNNYVSLTTYYDPADSLIKVQLQNPNWNLVYTSPTTIKLDQWNRVVVELQLSNPNSFGSAFYSGRIFVNYSSIPSRTYFGDYPTTLLIEDTNEITVDICSTMISGSSTRNSSIDGNYDMMNFMWYKGDESLFQNSSDPTCFLSGFLDPNQSACLICNVGYYLDGRNCLSSCSANEFLHSNTSSCQSCYYPSRYYTNTGYCLPCTLKNQSILGYSCINCDNTCASCTGTSPNQCKSCYSGAYLLSSNSSCVACNVSGYSISGFDCFQCDSSCLTCNGTGPSNCLSCPNSAYYLSSNQSCIVSDIATVQAAEAVGTTSKVIFISATASAAITYLPSKGNSPMLMRILQIMARITFMKLIDINYLTPLAKFYDDTDLGQFGLPNMFNKITNVTSTNNDRILAQLNSSGGDSSSNLFVLNAQGDATFNRYFGYSFSRLFLDDYGGIVFSSCITFVLYLIAKLVSKCFKDENSKTKAFLTQLAQAFERSVIMTLLVSRYMYLCSSLIFNYVFHPLNGVYEKASFGFAIFYTILLICIIGLALCSAFYNTKESKARLKPVRPLLNILQVLLQGYNRKRFIGRFFPFWTLLSDLMRVLVLLLLYKWRLVQLVFLIIMSLMTIALSLPKSVFRRNASRILMIGTEVGFIILCVLFFAMYFLQNSGSLTAYKFQLGLSWSAVIINISIILFQIIMEIVEFFRLRREKKRQEQQQKAIQILNQLESPSRLVEQSGNVEDPHNFQPIQNFQLIQIPDVSRIQSATRRPNKYEDVMVSRSGSRTRETVSIGDANNSQGIQLQNSPQRGLSLEQPERYEGNKLHVNRNRGPSRIPDSIIKKGPRSNNYFVKYNDLK